MSRFPPGLEPVEDLGPAEWVRQALKDWPAGRFHVCDLVPPGFEAYARVLHRPHRPSDEREPTGTWGERAAELGVPIGPEIAWMDLESRSSTGWEVTWSVEQGAISRTEAITLAAFLEGQTLTPASCWFAMWSGWGPGAPLVRVRGLLPYWRARRRAAIEARRERRVMAKLSTFEILGRSGRSCLLFEGAVTDVDRFAFHGWYQSPALWWPDDRAWFVHTEMDDTSTYVGGARSMIDRLVGEQILESFEVSEDSLAAL